MARKPARAGKGKKPARPPGKGKSAVKKPGPPEFVLGPYGFPMTRDEFEARQAQRRQTD